MPTLPFRESQVLANPQAPRRPNQAPRPAAPLQPSSIAGAVDRQGAARERLAQTAVEVATQIGQIATNVMAIQNENKQVDAALDGKEAAAALLRDYDANPGEWAPDITPEKAEASLSAIEEQLQAKWGERGLDGDAVSRKIRPYLGAARDHMLRGATSRSRDEYLTKVSTWADESAAEAIANPAALPGLELDLAIMLDTGVKAGAMTRQASGQTLTAFQNRTQTAIAINQARNDPGTFLEVAGDPENPAYPAMSPKDMNAVTDFAKSSVYAQEEAALRRTANANPEAALAALRSGGFQVDPLRYPILESHFQQQRDQEQRQAISELEKTQTEDLWMEAQATTDYGAFIRKMEARDESGQPLHYALIRGGSRSSVLSWAHNQQEQEARAMARISAENDLAFANRFITQAGQGREVPADVRQRLQNTIDGTGDGLAISKAQAMEVQTRLLDVEYRYAEAEQREQERERARMATERGKTDHARAEAAYTTALQSYRDGGGPQAMQALYETLGGTEGYPDIDRTVAENLRQQIIGQLDRWSGSGKSEQTRQLRQQIDDELQRTASLGWGQVQKEQRGDAIKMALDSGAIPEWEAANLRQLRDYADKVHGGLQTVASSSRRDLLALDAQLNPDRKDAQGDLPTMVRERRSLYRPLAMAVRERLEVFEKDPGAFSEAQINADMPAYRPGRIEGWAAMDAQQMEAALGDGMRIQRNEGVLPGNVKPLSNAAAENLLAEFAGLPAEQKTGFLRMVEAKAGQFSPDVFDQLLGAAEGDLKGTFSAGHLLLADLPPSGQRMLAPALEMPLSKLKAAAETEDVKAPEITAEARAVYRETFGASLPGFGTAPMYTGFQEAAERMALALAATGMPPREAAKEAGRMLFTDAADFQTGARGPNVDFEPTLRIPAGTLGDDVLPSEVAGRLNVYAGLLTPEEVAGGENPLQMGVLRQNYAWMTTGDGSAAQLYYMFSGARAEPVMAQDGMPIRVPFVEVVDDVRRLHAEEARRRGPDTMRAIETLQQQYPKGSPLGGDALPILPPRR